MGFNSGFKGLKRKN